MIGTNAKYPKARTATATSSTMSWRSGLESMKELYHE